MSADEQVCHLCGAPGTRRRGDLAASVPLCDDHAEAVRAALAEGEG